MTPRPPLRARLVVEGTPEEIDALIAELERQAEVFADLSTNGSIDFIVDLQTIDLGADGELVRHTLHPLSAIDCPGAYARRPGERGRQEPIERKGPLVRVYATRPPEEE